MSDFDSSIKETFSDAVQGNDAAKEQHKTENVKWRKPPKPELKPSWAQGKKGYFFEHKKINTEQDNKKSNERLKDKFERRRRR